MGFSLLLHLFCALANADAPPLSAQRNLPADQRPSAIPLPRPDRSAPISGQAPALVLPEKNPQSSILVKGPLEGNSCELAFSRLFTSPGERMGIPSPPQSLAAKRALLGGLVATAMGEKAYGLIPGRKTDPLSVDLNVAYADASPPPPIKKMEMPSKPELIKRAQEALATWKSTGKIPIDLGKFFLQTEYTDDPARNDGGAEDVFAAHEAVIAKAREIAAGPGTAEEKLRSVLAAVQNYAGNYCAQYAMLSDFYRTGCGNCESNTKLLISALMDAPLAIPEGKQLGVQLFSDHIQAVLVDKNKKEVTELLNGSVVKDSQAPVYSPAMLMRDYLQTNHANNLKMGAADLMILDSDASLGKPLPEGTNAKVEHDLKAGASAPGSAPKFRSVKSRKRKAMLARGAAAAGLAGEVLDSRAYLKLYPVRTATAEERSLYRADFSVAGFTLVPGAVIAATPELAREWSQLPDDDAAIEYMAARLQGATGKMFRTAGMRKLRSLREHSEQFGNLSDGDIYQIWDELDRVLAFKALSARWFGKDANPIEESPNFKAFQADFKNFAAPLQKEPEKYLQALDNLPPEKMVNFMRLMHYRDFAAVGLSNPTDNIYNLVANEKKVTYSAPDANSAISKAETILDLDFRGPEPKGTFYKGDKIFSAGSLTKGDVAAKEGKSMLKKSRPDATIEIKPETMAALLLKDDAAPAKLLREIWSTALTNASKRYLRDPEFSSDFPALLEEHFLEGFNKEENRGRYENLKFVKLSSDSAPVIGQGQRANSSYARNTYRFDRNEMPKVLPLEIAEAWQGVLDRQFQGKVKLKFAPATEAEARAAFTMAPPKPFSTTTDMGTSVGIGIGGFAIQMPPERPFFSR